MNEGSIVHETKMDVSGKKYRVQVFSGDNGRYFALTRFSKSDAIIVDGSSIEDVMNRHIFCLPLAVSCRYLNSSVSAGYE